MKKKKVLIVDDEKAIVETVKAYLEKDNFNVIVSYDGQDALIKYAEEKPDLIILDLMIPKINGEKVCKFIRNESNIPIVMLTAKISEENKLNGFDLGTDDYITKPFSPKELLARVNSIFKRISNFTPEIIIVKDLKIDFTAVSVEKNGNKINLTPNEFKILEVLARNPKRTYNREDLINLIFADNYEIYERTIDSHIKNLRGKIEDDKNKYIITVRGFGYKFNSIN